ncbi:short-chain dehydrogenase [Caballeronia ptereochthonis]|uniref:Short-chain dehydrogenase n=2 Tax=Caballeronia ptereochthonis TaxID=1777144 RepID=A0A158AT94_9BURK|nr:short-chain dehydrogenase [Caballeronia ptereochthonis]
MFACRDRQRGEATLPRLHAAAPDARAELAILDLASLAAVREFAQSELAAQRPIHILINNAGIMAPPKRLETADGFELQFGTNVLGHFAPTALLMPALERAAAESPDRPRIVTIASIAHKKGQIDFNDLQSSKAYAPMRAYRQSKLADLFRTADHSAFSGAVRALLGHIIGAVLNTDGAGALPTLYAATSPNVVDAGYYGPQGLLETRGSTIGEACIATQAKDAATAARLWQVCEELTQIRFRPS